jgi:nicotinamidase-related amidase
MKQTALILIDIQNGFDDLPYWGGNRNNPQAEARAAEILKHWREKNFPVYFIRHDSSNPKSKLFPGQPGNEIKAIVKPLSTEPVISKNVNSAFIGTSLKEDLDKKGIQSLVIVGLTTDHCVSTTTRMAGNYGYETYVISDATATFDRMSNDGEKFSAETIHKISLASLHDEFAKILDTRTLLQQFQ